MKEESDNMDKLVIFAVLICLAACQSTDDCPAGVPRDTHLRVFGGSCFQFVLSRHRTHSQAKLDCATNGGTLALVKSQATQDFLEHALTNDYHDSYDKLWIGLNDIDVENVFKWEDGTPLAYGNWAQGQGPNSTSFTHNWSHDDNDCVLMSVQNSGKWSEYPCEQSYVLFFARDEAHSYICQYALTHSGDTTVAMTTNAAVSGMMDTTVVVLTNPCPAFSCDLDCGTHGFQKNSTSGCYDCQCSSS